MSIGFVKLFARGTKKRLESGSINLSKSLPRSHLKTPSASHRLQKEHRTVESD